MASIREQTRHFAASSAPLTYPWRHCLSCLYVGPVAWSWWICLLFCCFPWKKNCGRWSTECAARFFSLLCCTPSNCQSAVNLTRENTKSERGGEGREGMPYSVRTVRWDRDWKRVRLFSFLPCCQVEQVVISRLSKAQIIPHVSGGILTHTHTSNLVTVLSACPRSQ